MLALTNADILFLPNHTVTFDAHILSLIRSYECEQSVQPSSITPGSMGRRPNQNLLPADQIPTLINNLVKARQDHKALGLLRTTPTVMLVKLERACLRCDSHADVERNADDLRQILRCKLPIIRRRDLPAPKRSGDIVDDACGDTSSVGCQRGLVC